MKVQCIHCIHFDMKSNRTMAVARAGHCPKTLQYGQYTSAMKSRDCQHFDAAPEEEVEKLKAWAIKRPIWNEERKS